MSIYVESFNLCITAQCKRFLTYKPLRLVAVQKPHFTYSYAVVCPEYKFADFSLWSYNSPSKNTIWPRGPYFWWSVKTQKSV